MRLTETVMCGFKVAKVMKENSEKVNCINFSANGELLITSSEDDQVVIYDCTEGTPRRTLNSKKYGVDQVQFTHAANTAIHCSTKVDDTIRYLSLHDNKYIRYFPGHTRKVVSLCMSPVDDTFLSGSADRTIRLWDLRSPSCQGLMHVPGRPVAAFDPEGLIFAAGVNSESVKLYDLRSFDKGPFANFRAGGEPGAEWTELKFSPDGKMMLVSTSGSSAKLVDAFSGVCVHSLAGVRNCQQRSVELSFTPDSQFVVGGGSDARLHAWSCDSGQKVASFDSFGAGRPEAPDEAAAILCAQFNPKYMMLATAAAQVSFWLPFIDE